MYLDDALLYNQGYMISINDLDSPLLLLCKKIEKTLILK